MYLIVAGFFFVFSACSGGASTEEAATDAPAEEVAPAEAAPAAAAQEAANVAATEENEEANENHDGHSH